MTRTILTTSLFLALASVLTASCGIQQGLPQGCVSDTDCGAPEGCTTWRCQQGQCKQENAPAGVVPATPSFEAPPCQRVVCDGQGSEQVEPDPTAVPTDVEVPACHRASCDATGSVVFMVDPTATPTDEQQGDCQKPVCDASGNVSQMPDPSDVPIDNPGDCQKPVCDASGAPAMTPADDPPSGVCMSFTCQNGQAMGTPANMGMNCSPNGFVCGNTGQCDTCPAADAACTDPGPGATAHALGSAHDFGTIGFCDDNEISLCGALQGGVTSYYRYDVSGGVTFCDYDPFVFVQSSAPVTLCQYFNCPTVTCPAGTTPDTLGGASGCCISGSATSMQVKTSCDDPQVFVTVKAGAAACTSFEVGFRS